MFKICCVNLVCFKISASTHNSVVIKYIYLAKLLFYSYVVQNLSFYYTNLFSQILIFKSQMYICITFFIMLYFMNNHK